MVTRVNPDMIVLARESRRLSQRELAERMGVSQGRISKYENDLLPMPDGELRALCRATGYRPSLFESRDTIVGLGSSMLFNRKRETTLVGTQKEIQAKVNITRFQLLRLLRSAELQASRRIERIDPDRIEGGPRAIAQRVRAGWSIPSGPFPSLTAAIESAGGLIVMCDFGTDQIDGAHLWMPGEPPMFFMNANASGDRHRFNLAHELGHAVMHEFPTGDIEREANEFASELLLPSESAIELDDLTIEKLARLKQRWKVSMAMIAYSAHALGMISDHKYRTLFARLSALGYRRAEPITIQVEQPTLVRQLLEFHRDSLRYSDDDMRSLLMADEPDFLQLPDSFKFSAQMRIDDKPFPIDSYRDRKVN